MPWSWVYGQDRVADVLGRSLAADRVSHAYLFHGPEGTGKRAAAVAFAQALQCERRSAAQIDACGNCPPCRKVARMTHPDVQLHLAVPSTHQRTSDSKEPTRAAIEDIGARIAALAGDLYAEIGYRRRPDLTDPAKTANLRPFYSVERVREEINPSLRFAPAEGRYKVAILTDAETLRTEAANSLLKVLEEPNPRTVIILTATHADRLLSTIVSRCQRLRFDPVPAAEIERALGDRGIAAGTASSVARMARGSVTEAIALASDEQLHARRGECVEFIRLAAAGPRKLEALDELIKSWSALGREPLRHALSLMLGWVRDVAVTRASGGEAAIVNVDQSESIQRFVEALPQARLESMVSLIEHAMELSGTTNVNQVLILINLGEGLRAAMAGHDRRRLFDPLAAA